MTPKPPTQHALIKLAAAITSSANMAEGYLGGSASMTEQAMLDFANPTSWW